jgi:hypothetical protein
MERRKFEAGVTQAPLMKGPDTMNGKRPWKYIYNSF